MPNTTNQNYPYPSLTDTPNGPSQFQDLAQAVDDSVTRNQADIANLIPPLLDFTNTATRLPTALYDGYVVRAKIATGIIWTLIWGDDDDAWSFAGGAPLIDAVTTSETRSTATYAALATAGPSGTIPLGLDGHYEIRLEAGISGATGDGAAYMAYKIGTGGTATDGTGIQQNNQSAAHVSGGKLATLAGGDAIIAQYRGNGSGTSSFADRRVIITPRYIQPA